MPLKGDAYPIDLNLKIAGIYDGPGNRDLRMCLFHWEYLDEEMKQFASRALPARGLSQRESRATRP